MNPRPVSSSYTRTPGFRPGNVGLSPTADFDYKTLTDEELGFIFADRKFGIKMKHHQLVSLAFSAERNRVMFPHDVGTCKTLTALETARQWGCKRILVVCPGSAFSAWEGDTLNYTKFSFTLLIGTRDERLAGIARGCNVSVVNYEGLKSLYAKLYGDVDGDGHGKWIINDIAHSKDPWDCVVFDEIHRVSNYKSLAAQICLELSKKTKHVIGLSGTPVDKSMLELFNIYMLVDLGRSLGTNFYQYRSAYFDPPKWGYEWKLKPGAREKILKRISGCTLRYSRQECFDLPEIQEIDLVLPPNDEFMRLQKEVVEGNMLTVGDDHIQTIKPEAKAVVLRELASGFFYYGEGENKKTYLLKENPKVAALLDIIQDTQNKIIVYCNFTAGVHLIESTLVREKVKFVTVTGEQNQAEKKRNIDAFSHDPNVLIMVAHTTCASEGFDGTASDTVIFFDPVASPKIYKQCVGRIHRNGQKKKCLVVHLVMDKSVDKVMFKNREERKTFVETVNEFMQLYHGGKL